MTKKARKRRSAQSMKPILEANKTAYAPWAYAGDPQMMKDIFPDINLEMLQRDDNDISSTGGVELPSEELLYDPATICRFGENVGKFRMEQGFTLESLAKVVGITPQQLHEIEVGKRKKIDRNILVLLSGWLQVSPLILLGGEKSNLNDPFIHISEQLGSKIEFIINRMYFQASDLLGALLFLSNGTTQRRKKLSDFLHSVPIIPMLDDGKMTAVVSDPKMTYYPPSGENKASELKKKIGFDPFECSSKLHSIYIQTPELFDAYVSIAALPKEKWDIIFELLVKAGFLSPGSLS